MVSPLSSNPSALSAKLLASVQKIDYRAPKPASDSTLKKVVKIFIATIIFPLGALWLIQIGIRHITAHFVSKRFNMDSGALAYSYYGLQEAFPHFQEGLIQSYDGTPIHFIHFPSQKKNCRKVIFAAPGLGAESASMSYVWMTEWKELYRDADVVFVDPRGVGKSSGKMDVKKGADDVYSVAQYFIEKKGFLPENTLFWGFSLGGGTAARGARLLQETYPEAHIHLVHENSFRSFTRCVENFLTGMLGFITKIALIAIDQDLCPEQDAKKLKGKKIVIYNHDDNIILEDAKYIPEDSSHKVFGVHGDMSIDPPHLRPLSPQEKSPVIQEIQALLR